jgi:hypothetical protein
LFEIIISIELGHSFVKPQIQCLSMQEAVNGGVVADDATTGAAQGKRMYQSLNKIGL